MFVTWRPFVRKSFPLAHEVFLLSIDRTAPGAITIGEVATLQHERGNNTVEDRVLVSIALFAGGGGKDAAGGRGGGLSFGGELSVM